MSVGPGKYDAECTQVRESTDAVGVVLAVVGGDRGSGFSVQATGEVLAALPGSLRAIADQIDQDLKGGSFNNGG